ncbi:MAG: hypothetical protein OXH34_03105 [Bacteroidetes bacterium]|nr:hypothetical protein [Bacteroidota bacterium]
MREYLHVRFAHLHVVLELNLPSYRLDAVQQWQPGRQYSPKPFRLERANAPRIDESLENKFSLPHPIQVRLQLPIH